MADEGRLTQIVYNLLHNAVKFTPKGEIAVHAAVEDGMARISVSDTGIGMDEQTARRVFLPYEQASRHRGGIGLGLSISKQLVELHGGSIDVRSAPNRGSTFSFTLPLVGARTAPKRRRPRMRRRWSPRRRRPTSPPLRRCRRTIRRRRPSGIGRGFSWSTTMS